VQSFVFTNFAGSPFGKVFCADDDASTGGTATNLALLQVEIDDPWPPHCSSKELPVCRRGPETVMMLKGRALSEAC